MVRGVKWRGNVRGRGGNRVLGGGERNWVFGVWVWGGGVWVGCGDGLDVLMTLALESKGLHRDERVYHTAARRR